MKIFKRTLLLLCVLGILLSVVVFAAETTPRAVFRSTAPDAEGYFTTTLTLYDMEVCVLNCVLRYNPAVLAPVDASGKATTDFDAFAQLTEQGSSFMTMGTSLDTQNGLFDFTCFTFPDTNTALVKDGIVKAGSDGFTVYTFRFKKIADGDPQLQIAAKSNGLFKDYCPEGAMFCDDADLFAVRISFESEAAEHPSQGEYVSPEKDISAEPAITADALLRETMLLPIGSHAAYAGGGVTAIYSGERDVTPYIKSSRTFVPLRFVSERLNAKVDWEQETRTAVITNGTDVIRISIGKSFYTVNGVQKDIDAPAELVSSRTMVPLRFIAEALQYQVDWDDANKVAIVCAGIHKWDMSGSLEKEVVKNGLMQINLYKMFV